MEGHGPDILCLRPQQCGKPLLQLVGRFVGKGDGDDIPGRRRFHGAQPVGTLTIPLRCIFADAFQKFDLFLRHFGGNLAGIASPSKADQIGNSVDQYRGFAAACTGKQKQRAFRCEDGAALHGVQLGKLGGNIGFSRGKESGCHLFSHRYTCLSCKMLLFYFILKER